MRRSFVVFGLLLSALSARAEGETKSELKSDLQKLMKNAKYQENEEITDAKLRADGGSLSQYSMKFSLAYYGPVLSDLGAKDQPNPDGTVGVYETSLGGSVSARYRLDSQQTLGLGTGLKSVHPFHGAERFDVNNPYLSYDLSSKIAGVQVRHSPSVSLITLPAYKNVGEVASVTYGLSSVYDLGASGFALGLESSFGYYIYERDYDRKDGKSARFNWSVYPSVKYNFNDKLSMNTSLTLQTWNPRSLANEWAMHPKTISQSVGLGYAYQRDVFLNPYMNFYPNKLSADRVTLNFSAIFSVL